MYVSLRICLWISIVSTGYVSAQSDPEELTLFACRFFPGMFNYCEITRNASAARLAATKAGDDCPNGFYGTNCNIRCPTTCLNNTCDKIDGSCSHGCDGDLYDERCNSNCSSHCKDSKCDVRTGRCIGCEDGYYGDMCEESCSTCNGPCRQLDGVCLTGCKDGYWGSNGLCLQTCSNCNAGGCRIEDGVCYNGCEDGFWGSNGLCLQTCSYCKPGGCGIENGVCYNGCHGDLYGERCQTNCSNHCKDGKCDDRTGRCFGCEDGYYGDMCEESCSTCNGPCRQLDGVCLTGCKDGYWGSNGLCLQTCSYCNAGDCRIEDGMCYNGCKDGVNNTKCHDCPNGFYGTNCNIRCPTTCLNNTCDKMDGSCSHGCHGDLYGERCNSNCSTHCKDGKCDVRTGRCIGCEDGYYGDMCEESCSTCNGPCRQLDGICLTDCKDGFWGSNGLCLQTCSYCKPGGCRIENGVCYNGCHGDLYGERCQTNCSSHCKDGKCDVRTGRCFGCEDGYYGDMCEESCSTCNGSCRQLDGVCLTGCKDGYWGSNGLCLQTCAYCNDGGCRIEDGVCYNGCKDGVNNTKCHDGCGSLPPRLNALAESVQNIYPIGAYVNYKCIEGAYLQGSSRARCRPSGEWDIPSFTCTIAKTCHEAHQLGASVTPTVVIKPDIELSALTVSCEVTDNGVYTVIGNCGAERTYVQGYEAARGFSATINYNLDLNQIINIANASAECEQFIKFECHHVHVVLDVGLTTRTGELATYLMGGVKGQMDCACNINDTCVDNLKCNCEKNDNVLRVDEGFIRYKEDLPITAILIGDTGDSNEYAYYTVGNLRCKG